MAVGGFIPKVRAENHFVTGLEGGQCSEVKIQPQGRGIAPKPSVMRFAQRKETDDNICCEYGYTRGP